MSTDRGSSTGSVHPATDGEIAAINLESARRRAWSRFAADAAAAGHAEAIVEQELLTAQFLGDLDALDRLEALAARASPAWTQFVAYRARCSAGRVRRRIASHDARRHLTRAALWAHRAKQSSATRWTIDQACGVDLDAVLAARRRIAALPAAGSEDLVPLGAAARRSGAVRRSRMLFIGQALHSYDGVSPFPLAWVVLPARHAVGRVRTRTDTASRRALVSTRNRLFAGLREGARASGGDLHEPGPNRRCGGAAPARAFERRSGGVAGGLPTC